MIRVNDLVIPEFVSTEQAVAWGRQQKPEDRRVVHAVYKTFERIALTTSDLQRKADFALQAQLIREAWEAIPDGPQISQIYTDSLRPAPDTNPAVNRSSNDTAPGTLSIERRSNGLTSGNSEEAAPLARADRTAMSFARGIFSDDDLIEAGAAALAAAFGAPTANDDE